MHVTVKLSLDHLCQHHFYWMFTMSVYNTYRIFIYADPTIIWWNEWGRVNFSTCVIMCVCVCVFVFAIIHSACHSSWFLFCLILSYKADMFDSNACCLTKVTSASMSIVICVKQYSCIQKIQVRHVNITDSIYCLHII